MKLTFWGAAGAVTGSMHLVETRGKRILLDCGMNQGRRAEADRKNRNLPYAGSSIDAVILSQAHIDWQPVDGAQSHDPSHLSNRTNCLPRS